MKRMVTDKEVIKVVNEAIEDGKVTIPSDLPEIQEGDVGKVLTVNSDETGVEWSQIPEELPSYDSDNEGQVLKVVQDDETGDVVLNWENESQELPSITAGDAGKVLQVNSGETGVEWATASGGSGGLKKLEYNDKLVGYGLDDPQCSVSGSSNNDTLGNSLFIFRTDWSKLTTPRTIEYNPGFDANGSLSSSAKFSSGSLYLGNSVTVNSPYRIPSAINSIINCNSGYNNSKFLGARESILFGDGWSSSGAAYQYSLLMGETPSNISPTNTKREMIFNGCLIVTPGGATDNEISSVYATMNKRNVVIIGEGHSINTNVAQNGLNIIGKYGTISDPDHPAALTVGVGTSTSARANCFETGNDGSEDYIKIGDTKITETQLQALLALLNA